VVSGSRRHPVGAEDARLGDDGAGTRSNSGVDVATGAEPS
jgi:hypothetical protein